MKELLEEKEKEKQHFTLEKINEIMQKKMQIYEL